MSDYLCLLGGGLVTTLGEWRGEVASAGEGELGVELFDGGGDWGKAGRV